jgi:hypothetical protein
MSPRVAMWKRDVEGPGQARHAYSRAVAARIMETWALTTGLRAKGRDQRFKCVHLANGDDSFSSESYL